MGSRRGDDDVGEVDGGGIEATFESTIVAFIDNDAAAANPDVFGGSSTYNRQLKRYTTVQPHLDLLQDLSWAIPEALGPQFLLDWRQTDPVQWETLTEKILTSQQDYEASQQGFWRKIWHGIGGAKDAIDPWVALIPNDFGLAVVKTGVAVLCKLAEKSKEKKQKIIDTFTGLRKILTESDPSKTSFRDSAEVRKHADQLYEAVVDSIRDMIRVATKKKGLEMPRRLNAFIKGKEYVPRPPDPPDTATILQLVADSAAQFQRAVSRARDAAIQRADRNIQIVGVGLALVHQNVKDAKQNTEDIITNLDEVGDKIDEGQAAHAQKLEGVHDDVKSLLSLAAKWEGQKQVAIAARENEKQEDQADSKNYLMGILVDQVKRGERDLAAKRRRIAEQNRMIAAQNRRIAELEAQKALPPPAAAPPPALLSPDDFSVLLAGRRSQADFLAQANQELERVLLERSRLRPRAQGQANSALYHAGFQRWLARSRSGLVLVDANLPGEPERLSAVSVFAATLVASLVTARPQAVVVHFFCGLHASPGDAEYGPNGLLRSVATQLVLKLVELERLDVSFVNDEAYLAELRSRDPTDLQACVALCQALYELVAQFPEGAEVYCIIDSVSWFDREMTFPLLRVVMECLQQLVDAGGQGPVFKVFLTNGGHASVDLRNLDVFQRQPERLIALSASNSTPAELSPHAMGRQLLRPSTPTPGRPRRDMSRWASLGGRHEDEHDDGGFETE